MICDSVSEVILSGFIIAENSKKGNRFLAGQDHLWSLAILCAAAGETAAAQNIL